MPSYTPYNPTGQPNYPTGQPVFQPGPTNFQNPPTAGNVGAVPPSYPTTNPPSSQPVAIFNPINTQLPVSGTGLTSAPPPSIPVSKATITPTPRVSAVSSNPLSQNSPLPAWNDPPTFAAKNKVSNNLAITKVQWKLRISDTLETLNKQKMAKCIAENRNLIAFCTGPYWFYSTVTFPLKASFFRSVNYVYTCGAELSIPYGEVSFIQRVLLQRLHSKIRTFTKFCVCLSVPQPSVPTPTPITAPMMTPLGEAPIAGQQAPPISGATATYRQSSPAPAPTQVRWSSISGSKLHRVTYNDSVNLCTWFKRSRFLCLWSF